MTRAAESLRGRTDAEVIAALGPATRIRFDSGYEVWLYRFTEPTSREPAQQPDGPPAGHDEVEREPPPSELVMLVTPSGIVAKVRVRSPAA